LRVQITTRKCEVPQDAQDRTTSLIEKLQKFEPSLQSAELVFEEERGVKEVGGILKISRAEPVVATGHGADFNSAADDLADKLSKILRRRRAQVRDRARVGHGERAED
jgi:ribosome-associated translation inhibitor RaiA